MIEARITKQIEAGAKSAGFTLDLDFRAEAGITVVFGPDRSGKTLLFDSIAGFARPDAGRIMLDDRILFDAASRVKLSPQQRNCGYVLQRDALFPNMTIRENLLFAADRLPRLERHRKVNETIERFQLGGDSAGQRQSPASERIRCLLARSLMRSPRLLLLDEPVQGLDARSRRDFWPLLRTVAESAGIPILLATNHLEDCFQAGGEVLVIREGRIVQRGRPRDILEQPANVEMARLLGIANVFQGEITALDPGRNTSRVKIQEHELTGTYFPGHLLGDRVWLCAHAKDLRAAGRNGARLENNQIPAKLLHVAELPHSVRLEFSGDICVDMPRSEFERQKDNKEWLVEFPPAALRVLS